MTSQRLKDRIALITGASRGIGRAVGLAFAREGAHVLLLARTRKALEEVDDRIRAGGNKATLIPLDLADGQAIDALGPSLYERFGRLDVLVGNAAILGRLSPLPHIPAEHWERSFAVNVTANWRLIRTLDPLLRRSDAGRVIFVTSGVARSARAYWAPYSVSKAALEALAKTYANETGDSPIKVNLVDPGATATRMRAEAYPGEDQSTLRRPEDVAEAFVPLAMPDWLETGQIVDAWKAISRP
ncbi:MAG TPA: SDR family NAD(P)-dependent oxidoreductase [Methyloceanibacter sp.]